MSTINPESIATMNVIKKDTIIDSVKYYGRIMIQGKTTSKQNYISLNEFKLKYISPSENATVFQIDGNVIDHLEEQIAGDVYLSSSTLMNHAPEYPDVDWNNRIIAVQGRILYTNQQLKSFRDLRTDAAWNSLTEILSNTLSKAQLIIPKMNNIEDILQKWESK